MELLKVDTLEEAREKLMKAVDDSVMRTERKPLVRACGFTLSKDIYAPCPVPGFRRSTVDGYALRSSETVGASEHLPVFLHIAGEIGMGENVAWELHFGECAYIPTGGMLPLGADACVMTEYCEEFDRNEIAVCRAAAPGENVVLTGEDMREAEKALLRGTVLKAQSIGVLAALGITAVPVYTPWSITVISTGDELVSPDRTPYPGQVRDINTYGICAQAEALNFQVKNSFVLKDEKDLLLKKAREAMQDSDIVVISGGSSKGKKDAAKEVIEEVTGGGILTKGLALKPGKPTILGYDRQARTLLAGLPGHPAAAMLVFELLVKWLWKQKTGGASPFGVLAKLSSNVPGAPGRRTCQLVRLNCEEDGFQAVPIWGKSGLIHTLADADGYFMIGENQEGCRKGELVKVYLLM